MQMLNISALSTVYTLHITSLRCHRWTCATCCIAPIMLYNKGGRSVW